MPFIVLWNVLIKRELLLLIFYVTYKTNRLIGQVGRVFANSLGDQGLNPRSSHTKDL